MELYFFMLMAMVCIVALVGDLNQRISFGPLNKAFALFQDKRAYRMLVVAFFLLAGIVRLYQYPQYPLGFNQDGAMGAVDAKALADYGTDRLGMRLPVLFQAWGYGSMSVLLSYLSVPFIKLFGLSPMTARIPMMLVSLAAVYVLYSFVRKAFGGGRALAVLAFLAINPWHFMQSRWALDCNLLPHFLLFSVFFLYKGVLEKKAYLYLSMFVFALTMYTYGIAIYSVPLLLLILCAYLLLKKEIVWRQAILCLGCYMLLAWPMFVMVFINLAKMPSIETPLFTIPSYYETNVRTNDILFFTQNKHAQLAQNFNAFTNIVLFQTKDLPWNAITRFGTMYLFTFPLVLLGFFYTVRRVTRKVERRLGVGAFFVLAWSAVAFCSGLLINNVNVNRINIVFYPILIFAGFGIYELVHRWKPALAVLVVLFAVSFTSLLGSYFGEEGNYLGSCFFYGFGESLHYLDEYEYDKAYITQKVGEGDYSRQLYEILTLFYLEIDARYYQGKKEAYGEDGGKWLPYEQRYQYVSFPDVVPDPNENAVYVFKEDEGVYFDEDLYEVTIFDQYGVAVPLSYTG